MEDIKVYYVIVRSLNMTPQKLSVQVGHGTDFVHYYGNSHKFYKSWLENHRKKIVLKVEDYKELDKLRDKLLSDNIQYELIEDNGLTEFNGKTLTGIVILPIGQESTPKYLKRLRLYV